MLTPAPASTAASVTLEKETKHSHLTVKSSAKCEASICEIRLRTTMSGCRSVDPIDPVDLVQGLDIDLYFDWILDIGYELLPIPSGAFCFPK